MVLSLFSRLFFGWETRGGGVIGFAFALMGWEDRHKWRMKDQKQHKQCYEGFVRQLDEF